MAEPNQASGILGYLAVAHDNLSATVNTTMTADKPRKYLEDKSSFVVSIFLLLSTAPIVGGLDNGTDAPVPTGATVSWGPISLVALVCLGMYGTVRASG